MNVYSRFYSAKTSKATTEAAIISPTNKQKTRADITEQTHENVNEALEQSHLYFSEFIFCKC